MTGNNPKLDLVNVDAIKRLVRFCQFVLKILSDVNQGPQLHQNFAKNDGNNPKLDLVNVDMHTKFGQILSFHSQDIERKQNYDVNQGP